MDISEVIRILKDEYSVTFEPENPTYENTGSSKKCTALMKRTHNDVIHQYPLSYYTSKPKLPKVILESIGKSLKIAG